MYKVGDKFELELAEKVDRADGKELFLIKGFNALMFDDVGLDKLRKIDPRRAIRDANKSYYSGQKDVAETLIRMIDLIVPADAALPPFATATVDAESVLTLRKFLTSVVDNCEIQLLPEFDWK